MQFRIFDGDMERWDEEEINLSPDELRRRFGLNTTQNQESETLTNNSQPTDDGQSASQQNDEICVPIDTANAHKITTPAYDIFDQELADKQFAELLSAGNPPKNQDE